MSYESCAKWRESAGAESAPDALQDSTEVRLPWTGNSFGLSDISFVAGRSNPKVVGVVGPESAGKTTLLAAWYLLLGRGLQLQASRFAGSFTLAGWENIANSLRWTGLGGPTFPVHTSSGAGRAPGLLHLAMRLNDGRLSDLLFADAPGEWFRRWAVHRDSPEAQGSRWVAKYADVFFILADSQALAGPGRGATRSLMQQLLQRLGDELAGRPVALVWSKTDVDVPDAVVEAVRDAATRHLGSHSEFFVSVYKNLDTQTNVTARSNGHGFLELLQWAIQARGSVLRRPTPKELFDDPLLAFGHEQH